MVAKEMRCVVYWYVACAAGRGEKGVGCRRDGYRVGVGAERTAFLRMRSGDGLSLSVRNEVGEEGGEREGVGLVVCGDVGLSSSSSLSLGVLELVSEYDEDVDEAVSEIKDALESPSSSSSLSSWLVAGSWVGRGSDAAAASYDSRARCSVDSLAAERLCVERERAS